MGHDHPLDHDHPVDEIRSVEDIPVVLENKPMDMERRQFLSTIAKGTLAVGAIGLAACDSSDDSSDTTAGGAATTAATQDTVDLSQGLPELEWEMATSWPLSLDTIYGGAVVFADAVSAMSGGKFKITPRASGEIAGGLEVLNVVQDGAVPVGHTASYYYVGQSPVTAFGTALPFGFTARQQNAWLYEGGGLELLQAFYAERFGVIQFPAGNTGVQMGGWFNKEINSVQDLQGLKMRIPGLGGQVMERLGATVQVLPGAEIFQALSTGAIDATEWVGPYDDTKLAFQDAAQYYYYPGWWEPGPSLEVQIPVSTWNELPAEYQAIVKAAAFEANTTMMARYDALNPPALNNILNSDIELRRFPDDVLVAAETESFALYDEIASSDPDYKSILDNWSAFRTDIQKWHALAETAMLNFGALQAGLG